MMLMETEAGVFREGIGIRTERSKEILDFRKNLIVLSKNGLHPRLP